MPGTLYAEVIGTVPEINATFLICFTSIPVGQSSRC